jgi:ribosome-associated protein
VKPLSGPTLTLASGQHIALSDVTFLVTTSSGPGGQHANRSLTAVEVRFNVHEAQSISPVQRVRLLESCGPEIRSKASRFRSQAQNRAAALDQLAAKISAGLHRDAPRRATRPTRGSVDRRVAAKKSRGETKRLRRSLGD